MSQYNKTIAQAFMMIAILTDTEYYISKQELAELLGVSKRTVHDYKKALIEVGIEIEAKSGRFGGYRIINERFIITPEYKVWIDKKFKEQG